MGHRARVATFRDALAIPEFRAIWIASSQSTIGDQLARVALALIVFHRTHSSTLTALTYALTFLPSLIGGTVLSGLADRYPRKAVMIGSDLARAALIGSMAVPGVPTAAIYCLLIAAVLANAPFTAAQSATLPDVLPGDLYVVGMGLFRVTLQAGQLAGFALGGIVVSAFGPRPALALDALTFLISAAMLSLWLTHRPLRATERQEGVGLYYRRIAEGAQLVFGNPALRTLAALSWLAGLFAIPEGVAAPYAVALGAGATAVGFLMAADPAGTAVGAFAFVRFVPPAWRHRLIGPMAALTGVPLILCAFQPGLTVSVLLWAMSGFFSAYQVQVQASFVLRVPPDQRGQAIGIASTGLIAGQGLGILAGGLLADALSPRAAIAIAGLIGVVLAVWLSVQLHRHGADLPDSDDRAERANSVLADSVGHGSD